MEMVRQKHACLSRKLEQEGMEVGNLVAVIDGICYLLRLWSMLLDYQGTCSGTKSYQTRDGCI